MRFNCEMNAFSENPLFLFVDDLNDNPPSFADEGKIVELFDTGCDARTPGAALKCPDKLDSLPIKTIGGTTRNSVLTSRKISINNSVPVAKKTAADHSALGDAKRNITVARKSSNEEKTKDTQHCKGNGFLESNEKEVKAQDENLVNENSRCSKALDGSRERKFHSDERKADSPCSNRSLLSTKYAANNRAVKSTVQEKFNETPKARTTTRRTFEGKSGSTRSATNPRTISPSKAEKVISEASLDHGIKKLVNRAVDKDSLSNCSRQYEVRKTSGAPFHPKSSYASRLPRSLRTAKTFSRDKSGVAVRKFNGTGEEILANSECQINEKTIVPVMEQKLRAEDLDSKEKVEASFETRNNDGEIELSMKIRRPNNLSSKSSPTRSSVSVKTAPSSTRAKITASKMPLPKFNKNSLARVTIESPKNSGESKENESGGPDSKLGEKVQSSKISIADATRPQDSGDKKMDERPKNWSLASPSSESCNSTLCNNELKDGSIGFKTKLPKRRAPLIVPKLMDQFRLLDKKQNEVSKCQSRDLSAIKPSLLPVVETKKSKTESLAKSCSSAEALSKEISERLSRFSSHLQEALDSGIPEASSGGKESRKISRREVRDEESKPKEGNVKANVKRRFGDTRQTLKSRATPQTSNSGSGACKTKESKSKPPSFLKTTTNRNTTPPPSAESKVPRPVVAKRISRKEVAPLQSSSAARTRPQKQVRQEVSKNLEKASEARKDAKLSSLPETKPAECQNVESVESSETTSAFTDEDSEEDIPIMDPALYNQYYLVSPRDEKSENPVNVLARTTIRCRGKLESWIDGHEQAYLKGRAIGLKVASMARAAKVTPKRELIKTSAKINTEEPRPNRAQEIVELGVSLIEKVIADKRKKNCASPDGGDRPPNHLDFYGNSNCNSNQWLM